MRSRPGSRPTCASFRHSGELQGAVPAGRRDRPERDRADEPVARTKKRRTTSTPVSWATRSIAEASHYCRVNVAASGAASGFTAIPSSRVAPRPGRRLRSHLRHEDDRRAASTTGCPTPARCRWWRTCRTSCRGDRRLPLRRIYGGARRKSAPGRTHLRHRPRRPAGRRPADHARGLRLHAPAANNSMITSAAHLRDLPRRAGVPLDQEGGASERWRAQSRQGRAAYDTLDRAASTSTASPGTTAR